MSEEVGSVGAEAGDVRRTRTERKDGTMLRALAGILMACGFACASAGEPAAPESSTPTLNTLGVTAQAAELVRDLGSEDYSVREAATSRLIKLGDTCLPALKRAAASDDPEVAWRARDAARMIRWGITPEQWSRLGDLIVEFEQGGPPGKDAATMQERIVRVVRTACAEGSMPFLRKVVRSELADSVKRTAAIMLADLGSEGLAVLMEENVQIAGLDPYDSGVHVMVGNSFLNEARYDRAEHHYMKALELEPGNFIAMYNMACVRSRQNRADEAFEWLQRAIDHGYDDFEWMEKDSDLDNIRKDERYQEMIRRGAKGGGRPPEPMQ